MGTDQVLDGVHFHLATDGPEAAGRYAMVRNLSDVAAMAAVPCLRRGLGGPAARMERDQAEAIYLGMRDLGDQFACPVVGGDVGAWEGARHQPDHAGPAGGDRPGPAQRGQGR